MALDKVIDSAQLDADLTAVADAIRTKGGTTEALEFPGGFVSAVEGIQAGGGGYSVEDFYTRTNISGDIVLNCESIPAYGFQDTNITSVRSETLTRLGTDSYDGDRVFNRCKQLKTAHLPNVRDFYKCNYTFAECTSLTDVDLSSAYRIGSYTFRNCTALKRVALPKATILYDGIFQNSAVECVDMAVMSNLSNSTVFQNCSVNTLILRNNGVCTLGNVATFNNSPFASNGTGGTVYVPSALITQYQQATNWATLYAAGTCNFVAIEGSEYE